MIRFFRQHKTYTLLFIISIIAMVHLGYVNLFEPFAMVRNAKNATGETFNILQGFFDFLMDEKFLELLKALTPILVPIITFKLKSKMDDKLKHTTNKVVRGKLGIADRRKSSSKVKNDRRKK